MSVRVISGALSLGSAPCPSGEGFSKLSPNRREAEIFGYSLYTSDEVKVGQFAFQKIRNTIENFGFLDFPPDSAKIWTLTSKGDNRESIIAKY